MSAHIAIVLRSGGKHGYAPEHANRLLEQLRQFAPGYGVITLSDSQLADGFPLGLKHDWPGWWSKMELFRPDIFGDLFYLDLDTTLVDDIRPMIEVGVLAGLSHRGDPKRKMCSGVMYLPARYRSRIWDLWQARGPENVMRGFRGDQDFLYGLWPNRWQRFEKLVPGCVVSFKYHVQPAGKVPDGARMVYYHGHPKSWDPGGELP